MQRRLVLILSTMLVSGACGTTPPPEPAKPEPAPPAPEPKAPPPEAKAPDPEPQKVLVALKRVHFALASSKLNAVSRAALDEAAATLKEHKDLELEIEGHADERGSEAFNQRLGEERAQAVQSYLAKAGVDRSRMSANSKGASSPLATGSGPSAWNENRRVEFRVARGNAEIDLKQGVVLDDHGRPVGGKLQKAHHRK
jgi:outer membrane protein OmpA-like peptidoglycan-associated protein